MTRAELTAALMAALNESGLDQDAQIGALADCVKQVKPGWTFFVTTKRVSPRGDKVGRKFRGPLLRPSGQVMGKKKREAKEKD